MNKILKIIPFLLLFLVLGESGKVLAQSNSLGATYIGSGLETGVINNVHTFSNGGGTYLPSIIGTARTGTNGKGILSFSNAAQQPVATNNAFVDGYAKSYLASKFIFPIGDNGVYAPIAISAASVSQPVDAAYYNVDPAVAITTSLAGANEIALPTGAPFAANKGTGVSAISSKEYWDINGAGATTISLSWNSNSDVKTMTSSSLANLSILGWDGSKWQTIASKVDGTSIKGFTSTLDSGSITTNVAITPDTYSVYTLGASGASGVLDCSKFTLYPVPVEGVAQDLLLIIGASSITNAGSSSVSFDAGSGFTALSTANFVAGGAQKVTVSVHYDGTKPLVTLLNIAVSGFGSCTLDLKTPDTICIPAITNDKCSGLIAGPKLK